MLAIGEVARQDCLTLEQCGRRIDAGLRAQRES